MRTVAISVISMLIGFYVIEALASLFLIHGASNNKRLFLVPWMIERATQLTFYMVLLISIGFYFFTSPATIGYSLAAIIFGGITLCEYPICTCNDNKLLIKSNQFVGFNLYCFMCVYSLFALMRDAEEYQRLTGGPQRQQPPNYGNTGTTYVKIWTNLLATTWLKAATGIWSIYGVKVSETKSFLTRGLPMEIIKAKNKFDTRDQLRSLRYFNDYLIKKNIEMNVKTAMNIRKFAVRP